MGWPKLNQWTDRKKSPKQKELKVSFDDYGRVGKKHLENFFGLNKKKREENKTKQKNQSTTKPNPCSSIPLNPQGSYLPPSFYTWGKVATAQEQLSLTMRVSKQREATSPEIISSDPQLQHQKENLTNTDMNYPTTLKDSSNPNMQGHRRVI